ncbi:hypothetical protein KJ865_00055, partial [Myxococcota bacterium]|nr:hypothetical protein [Myxococcota bacterium]
HCILNPTWEICGTIAPPADADLVIDNTLYDLKLRRNRKIELHFFDQIIGYALLSSISKIKGVPEMFPITHIGFIYPRYDKVVRWPTNDIIAPEHWDDVVTWFREGLERDSFIWDHERFHRINAVSGEIDWKKKPCNHHQMLLFDESDELDDDEHDECNQPQEYQQRSLFPEGTMIKPQANIETKDSSAKGTTLPARWKQGGLRSKFTKAALRAMELVQNVSTLLLTRYKK